MAKHLVMPAVLLMCVMASYGGFLTVRYNKTGQAYPKWVVPTVVVVGIFACVLFILAH
jgi:cytochrome c-type biogenesis protein CcmH/NrfF